MLCLALAFHEFHDDHPHRGVQANILATVARGRSSHLNQGSTNLKTRVENLGRGFAQMAATIDNCRCGAWILSCFLAGCSKGRRKAEPTPLPGIPACGHRATSSPRSMPVRPKTPIPRSIEPRASSTSRNRHLHSMGLMIPVKGRNVQKFRDKPEDPKYVLKAVPTCCIEAQGGAA